MKPDISGSTSRSTGDLTAVHAAARQAPEATGEVEYSLWVLEYAVAPSVPRASILYGQHGGTIHPLPYVYWLLQSEALTLLVDTGFSGAGAGYSLAEASGVANWLAPVEVLGRVGVSPDDVDAVVITHGHYDHMGNTGAFPRAKVYIQRRELEGWMWASALPAEFSWLRESFCLRDLTTVQELAADDRLRLVERDQFEVAPRIQLRQAFDTHTFGSQYVVVEAGPGQRYVIASDGVFDWDNLLGAGAKPHYVPLGLAVGSQVRTMSTMAEMLELVEGDYRRILPGHDAKVWEAYNSRVFDDGLHVAEVCVRSRPGPVSG